MKVVKHVQLAQALDTLVWAREIDYMTLDSHLLQILRCPKSLGELILVASEEHGEEYLFCPQSKLRYRIEEGIAVMLIDEAEKLDDVTCQAIVDR